VPLSEHDEGYFMEYACGRVDTDAYGERACRLDPRFPKLEEYEFVLKEDPNERSSKWTCFAFAKTPNARRLDLGFHYGRTEEEARQRLIDRYQTYARGE